MKRADRDQWCAALRSGDFLQGTHNLCRGVGTDVRPLSYCCLGVLCELHGILDGHGTARYGEDSSFAALPTQFRLAVGLEASYQAALILANDCGRKNFAAIADWIEQHVPVEES